MLITQSSADFFIIEQKICISPHAKKGF